MQYAAHPDNYWKDCLGLTQIYSYGMMSISAETWPYVAYGVVARWSPQGDDLSRASLAFETHLRRCR